MTTEEGNKLIANFCMVERLEDNKYCFFLPDHVLKFASPLKWLDISEMKFHLLWEWLMPVVEKIESIKDSDDYEVDIFGNCCDIGGKIEVVGKTKIEATWKAVTQFIQWYNFEKNGKTNTTGS